MQGTCPDRESCEFFMSIHGNAVLKIKYATMYPFCNSGRHESCMRWWLMKEGKKVPSDLLPDGGKDLFAAEAHRAQMGRQKVLVVDDIPLFRKALMGLVQEACSGVVDVVEADSAEQAMDVLQADSVGWTAVVTDYNMGVLTGYDLIKQMRANPAFSQLPAIVFSSDTDDSNKDRCGAMPRVRWLEKRPEKQPFIEAWNDLVVGRKA